MPFPSEHSCRLKDPSAFEKDSFRRIKSGSVSLIIGKLKGESNTTAQAIRYPKDSWDAGKAEADCKKHSGSFTAAASAQAFTKQELDAIYADPLNNDLIP